MSKIFWIDKPIDYEFVDRSRLFSPTVKSQSNAGWHYSDDEEDYYSDAYVGHEKEFPSFDISIGDKLLTRNKSIIVVGKPNYISDRRGLPNRVDFWFFKDTIVDDFGSSFNGTMTHYDKNLRHKSGNHIDRNPGYDIVGLYDDKGDKCPCCNRRYDGLKD